jgi:hypothetical protein
MKPVSRTISEDDFDLWPPALKVIAHDHARRFAASIFISDARTGDPIAGVILEEHGEELPSTCQEDPAHPELCFSQIVVLTPAVHEISVEAPGYEPAIVTVDTTAMPSIHLAVQLDAGE